MRLDIRPASVDQLSNFTAAPAIMSIVLKWTLPEGSTYKAAEVWVNTVNNRDTATLLEKVAGNTFTHNVTDIDPRYYWIRAITQHDRPDGLWTGPASASARQAGATDIAGVLVRNLALKATSQVFQIDKANAISPTSTTLTVTTQGLSGTPNWTVTSGSASLGGAANATTRTLTPAGMGTDTVTIRVSQDGLTDSITIAKVREGKDGSNGITGILTNESVNLNADYTGLVTDYGPGTGIFQVYDGVTEKTTSGDVAYSMMGSTGISATINSSGFYSVSNMTADTATVNLRAYYKGMQMDKVFTISKAKNGAPGSQGTRGTLDIIVTGYSQWPTGTTAHTDASAIFKASTGSDPLNRDRMTMGTGTNVKSRFFSNGQWLDIAQWINGNMVVNGTLSTAALDTGMMTGQTIRTSATSTRIILNEVGAPNTLKLYTDDVVMISLGTGGGGTMEARSALNEIPAIWAAGKTNTSSAILVSGNISMLSGEARLRNTVPYTSMAHSLGLADTPWQNIYSGSAVTVVSDRRAKLDIEDSSLGLDFIMSLRPVSYRMKVAAAEQVPDEDAVGPFFPSQPPLKTITREGVRIHHGFISQEVHDALVAAGMPNASIWSLADPSDPDSPQALRNEELISPTVKAVQDLTNIVQTLKAEVENLKATIAAMGQN